MTLVLDCLVTLDTKCHSCHKMLRRHSTESAKSQEKAAFRASKVSWVVYHELLWVVSNPVPSLVCVEKLNCSLLHLGGELEAKTKGASLSFI